MTFKMAMDLIKKNVELRRNALRFTGPAECRLILHIHPTIYGTIQRAKRVSPILWGYDNAGNH